MPPPPGQPWLLYIAPGEARARIAAEMRARVRRRGDEASRDPNAAKRSLSIREHGLLYLPRPYVVPGGRFNEMYGWDSYFIQVGLLRDDELQRARDMVENFLYEIT